MKTVLLLDDEFEDTFELVTFKLKKIGVVIESGPTATCEDALRMIREHPEADVILLDGFFTNGNCEQAIRLLTKNDIQKIICFSGNPGIWKKSLREYGVRHFPENKISDVAACVEEKCNCK